MKGRRKSVSGRTTPNARAVYPATGEAWDAKLNPIREVVDSAVESLRSQLEDLWWEGQHREFNNRYHDDTGELSRNRHHPEHHINSFDMNLVDLIEMVVDWWAASRTYQDKPLDWDELLKKQAKRFGFSKTQMWVIHEVGMLLQRFDRHRNEWGYDLQTS